MASRTQKVIAFVFAATFGFGAVACGTTDLGSDGNAAWAEPGVLLGDWIAANMEQQRQADPSMVEVVTDTFTLTVDSEGRYIASLLPANAIEQGWIQVQGPSVIFRPTSPPGDDDPATLLVVADTFVITGDSEFDFGAGMEPSILVIDLVAR